MWKVEYTKRFLKELASLPKDIQFGDYRIGLTLNKKNQTIICQRVAHRREIYQIFP